MKKNKLSIFKKIILTLFTFLYIFSSNLVFPVKSFAQNKENNQVSNSTNNSNNNSDQPSTWYNQGVFEWYGKVYEQENPSEIFGERYTAAQVQWIFYSLVAGVLNLVPGNPELTVCIVNKHSAIECGQLLLDALQKLTSTTQGRDGSNSLAGSFFNIVGKNPISGINYTKSIVGKFSLVKEANAQGFGFNNAAQSVQFVWQATRNISYALIVLAVIVMAFMIMFRVKISPQLVVSVQSALPNIIASLILITFSYAIAGFMIDLMYVVIGIIASLLVSTGFSNDTFVKLFEELTTGHGVITIMYQYWIAFVYTAFLNIFTSETDFVLATLMFILAILSILFIIYWSLKIIVVVVKNYAMLILTIVTGPLEILVGAITGKSTFGSWLKKLVTQLAVYPLIGLIFFFSFFFLWQGNGDGTGLGYAESMAFNVKQNLISDNDWSPPFTKLNLSTDSGPSASDGLIWLAVSLIIFSQATKAAEIVQSLFSGKPFAFGSAIGEATEGAGQVTKTVSNFAPAGLDKKINALGDAVVTIGKTISR